MGTVKYTGPVASFHCPTNAEIRSLKVHFSPKQLGEGDPSPENIRPIEGWDGVEIYRNGSLTNYEFGVLGKNKFDGEWEIGALGSATGQNSPASDCIRTKNMIPVAPGEKYTISRSDTTSFYMLPFAYKKDGSFSRYLDAKSNTPIILSMNDDEYYLKFYLYQRTTPFENCQIELGSTATAYEPYDPNKTVYGGWVDLVSGEVCEEQLVWTVDDINFNIGNSDSYNGESGKRFSASWPVGSSNDFSDDINTIAKCNILPTVKITNSSSNAKTINWLSVYKGWGRNTIYGCLSDSVLNNDTSIENIKTYLKNNNFKVLVKFATPNTYNLAPTELQTFLGQNNVWSNADYVEVEYDLHETQDILARKQFIIANQPHLEEVSGSIATFNTDVVAPLKECKIEFKPVQDLHGYSNPWPGGGGKNIAKPYDNSYVSSTYVSFDYSAENGTFRCYGTASASSTHSSPSATNAANNDATFTLPAGTYTLSIIDGDGANIYAQCVSSTETVLAETTSYTTFTTNESLTVFVRLKVAAAATVDKTVKIQLEKGSSATAYVPYENVCLISGWTGINLTKTGKNLLVDDDPEDPNKNYYNSSTGKVNYYSEDGGYFVREGTGVAYSAQGLRQSTGSRMFIASKDMTIIYSVDYKNMGTDYGIRFYVNGTRVTDIHGTADEKWHTYSRKCDLLAGQSIRTIHYGGIRWRNQRIEIGDTSTEPEEYKGIILPIDWTTEAGTVYGGYVDLVTGEVVQTWISRLGSEMDVQTSSSTDEPWVHRFTLRGPWVSSAIGYENGTGAFEWASDKIPHGNARENVSGLSGSGVLYIYDNTISTAQSFKEKYADTQFVYQLRPTAYKYYTIDPITLKTLRGTNNIWSNSNGDITVRFWTH